MTGDRDEQSTVERRRRLADALASSGDLRTAPWRTAVETVSRHVFVPAFFRRIDTPKQTMWDPVTVETVANSEWLELVYTDETWVTQLDHTVHPGDVTAAVPGTPTSSSTLPGLVVRMLEELRVDDDSRVLEIGTGTGYSTALLSQRLGDDQVTSIEIDPAVAGRASMALHKTGYKPRLVVGDGLAGHATGAPYDRVVATCSVRHVPPSWLTQTRRGGLILTTLLGWLDASSGLIRLEVTGEGTAEGTFVPGSTDSFMPARAHDRPPLRDDVYTWLESAGTERPTTVGADVLAQWEGWTEAFIAQLAAPTAQLLTFGEIGGPMVNYLVDEGQESFAALLRQPDDTYLVRQVGPVALWDAVENAITAWRAAGSPGPDHFRISVTPTGQTITIDTPARPLAFPLR